MQSIQRVQGNRFRFKLVLQLYEYKTLHWYHEGWCQDLPHKETKLPEGLGGRGETATQSPDKGDRLSKGCQKHVENFAFLWKKVWKFWTSIKENCKKCFLVRNIGKFGRFIEELS